MKITVCIGSSCHIKGSQNNLDDKVELGGTFCMGQCQKGVCVTVDDTFFSVSPDTVTEFFNENVLAKI